jgi:acetyltransferase-like isoleucine patch superfamily enzyme
MRSMPQSIHQTGSDFEYPEGFFSRILTKLNSRWLVATYPFAGKGSNLSLHYASEISRRLAPYISLGDRVEIGKHTWFHTWPSLGTDGVDGVKITIEDDCRVAAQCTITAENSIHLERDVVLEKDVLVMDHAHAYEDLSRPIHAQGVTPGGKIRIGKGCRIGRGAAILCSNTGELVLGHHCVVAPGAVVTRSFPPDSVLSGNPARVLRKSSASGDRVQQDPLGSSNGRGAATIQSEEGLGDPSEVNEDSSNRSLKSRSRAAMTEEDPLSWVSRTASKLRTLWLGRTYPFALFAKGAWAHYSCHITRSGARYISIGEKVGLARDVRLDVSASASVDGPVLILEEGSGLQRRCVISARNQVRVMENVIFGPSVLVSDHGSDAGSPRREGAGGTIRIEEECWIGFGCVIVCEQGELTIGRHSVVGANSVVRRSIPSYSVVAGNPARIVKQYDFSEGKWVLGCIRPSTAVDTQCTQAADSALSESAVASLFPPRP